MAIRGYFFTAKQEGGVYDRKYTGTDLARWLAGFFSSGIMIPNGGVLDDEFEVTSAGGMSTQVNLGKAIAGLNGRYYGEIHDTPEIITHPVADEVYDRIDRVVFECSIEEDVRAYRARYITGIPSADPVAPEIEQSSTVFQLGLATVNIGAGVTEIIADDITDTREDASICGIANVLLGVKVPDENFIPIRNRDAVIPITGWVVSASEDYAYERSFTDFNVTADDGVKIEPTEATMKYAVAAGIARVITTYDGGYTVYAQAVPTAEIVADITIEKGIVIYG